MSVEHVVQIGPNRIYYAGAGSVYMHDPAVVSVERADDGLVLHIQTLNHHPSCKVTVTANNAVVKRYDATGWFVERIDPVDWYTELTTALAGILL